MGHMTHGVSVHVHVCVYIAHLDWILTRVGPYGLSGLQSIQTTFPGSMSQSGKPLNPAGQQILPDFSVPGDLAQLSLVAKWQNQNVTSFLLKEK